MEAKEYFVFVPLFLLFARAVGVSGAHLASVILTDTALGFGRLPVIANVFSAHHSLHAALDCFPIGVPGKGSTEDSHTKNTGSRVSDVSFSPWFAAGQPSSLQCAHQCSRGGQEVQMTSSD